MQAENIGKSNNNKDLIGHNKINQTVVKILNKINKPPPPIVVDQFIINSENFYSRFLTYNLL